MTIDASTGRGLDAIIVSKKHALALAECEATHDRSNHVRP